MKKTCFVICPIGEKGSDTRRRSDQLLKHIISPAVKSCGYEEPVRADNLAEPGMITSQVIQRILDDTLVVADLTERNPNVFYELAVRHAIRLPLIQLVKRGEPIPFDVAGMRTIHFDTQGIDSVDETKREIAEQIVNMEKKGNKIETPISISVDLKTLRGSDNPEDRSLAEVLSVISDLRSAVADLQKRVGNPESLLPPDYLSVVMRRLEVPSLHPGAIRDLAMSMRRLVKEFPAIRETESYITIRSVVDYLESRSAEARFHAEKERL